MIQSSQVLTLNDAVIKEPTLTNFKTKNDIASKSAFDYLPAKLEDIDNSLKIHQESIENNKTLIESNKELTDSKLDTLSETVTLNKQELQELIASEITKLQTDVYSRFIYKQPSTFELISTNTPTGGDNYNYIHLSKTIDNFDAIMIISSGDDYQATHPVTHEVWKLRYFAENYPDNVTSIQWGDGDAIWNIKNSSLFSLNWHTDSQNSVVQGVYGLKW